MKRRTLLAAPACLWIAAAAAAPASARKYVVLSLVGNIVNVVESEPVTGSLLDRNRHASIPITDGAFDKVALLATDDALERAEPSPSVTLLAASSPALFDEPWKLFDGKRIRLPDDLSASVKGSGATHLVILTKHREQARLRVKGGFLGNGMLEGIGFYIDRRTRMRDSESLEGGQGFLAPYAYLKVSLAELATSTVVASEIITQSHTLVPTNSSGSFDPWDTLAPAAKVSALQDMLREELARAVPLLLAAA